MDHMRKITVVMLQDALNTNIIPALLEEANTYNMEHNTAEYKFLLGYT